jgi:hypothetical protein
VRKRTRTPTENVEAQELELVEQTLKKVAERDGDIALLAKLDGLRAQVRARLRRRSEA